MEDRPVRSRSGDAVRRYRSPVAADRSLQPPDRHRPGLFPGGAAHGRAGRRDGGGVRPLPRRRRRFARRCPAVAICRFTPTDAAPDPLFAFVPQRRSLKEAYDTDRPVPSADLERVAAATRHFGMGFTTDPATVQEMRDISTEAIRIEFATERTLRESVELFRIGHREVNANPDGLEFMGPMFETLRVTGLFTREASMNPEGIVARSADASFVATMQTAMGHIWQVTPTNTRLDQIRAGIDWVRINLAATELGLGLQPLSQALQEYPEMASLYDDIHRRLAPEGGTVQMWARVGYGPDVMATPRWPLEAKLVRGTG